MQDRIPTPSLGPGPGPIFPTKAWEIIPAALGPPKHSQALLQKRDRGYRPSPQAELKTAEATDGGRWADKGMPLGHSQEGLKCYPTLKVRQGRGWAVHKGPISQTSGSLLTPARPGLTTDGLGKLHSWAVLGWAGVPQGGRHGPKVPKPPSQGHSPSTKNPGASSYFYREEMRPRERR